MVAARGFKDEERAEAGGKNERIKLYIGGGALGGKRKGAEKTKRAKWR